MMLNFSRNLQCGSVAKRTVLCMKSKSSPQNSFLIVARYAHHNQRNESFCTNYYVCRARAYAQYCSPWFIFRKLGIPYKYIVKFRRKIKRYTFPWVAYSIPTALAIGIGDILAQTFEIPYTVHHAKDENVHQLKRHISFKDIDYYRTAKFMLIGLFVMGPLLSRWNIFICRKLSYNTPQMFLIKKVAADILILSPLLLLLGMALWDFDVVYNSYPKLEPLWEKRLKKPFWEIMQFNLMTRPFMDLIICLLLPSCLRKFIRRPYEILFFAYVSSVFAKHNLGNIKKKKVALKNDVAHKKDGKKKCKAKKC